MRVHEGLVQSVNEKPKKFSCALVHNMIVFSAKALQPIDSFTYLNSTSGNEPADRSLNTECGTNTMNHQSGFPPAVDRLNSDGCRPCDARNPHALTCLLSRHDNASGSLAPLWRAWSRVGYTIDGRTPEAQEKLMRIR